MKLKYINAFFNPKKLKIILKIKVKLRIKIMKEILIEKFRVKRIKF